MNDEYNHVFQEGLIKALASDPDFFLTSKLQVSDFDEPDLKIVFGTMLRHKEVFNEAPGAGSFSNEVMDEIKSVISEDESAIVSSISEKQAVSVGELTDALVEILRNPDKSGTKYWRSKLPGFIAQQRARNRIDGNKSLLDQVNEARKIANEAEDAGSSGGLELLMDESYDAEAEFSDDKGLEKGLRVGTGIWPMDRRMGGGGLLKGQVAAISAPSGLGKALVNSDFIPTPDGFRKVGDIRPGDFLFDQNGNPIKVLMTHPQPEKKKVWVVTFTDGRKVRCCGDHNWEYWYQSHRGDASRVETTRQIYERARSRGFKLNSCGYLFKVRKSPCVDYPEKELTLDPYVVGALIGNGCLREKYLTVSSGTREVPETIATVLGAEAVRYSMKTYSYMFKKDGHVLQTKNVITGTSEDLLGKYSHEKGIPEAYLTGSIGQRMRLLQGLLDTDGSISKEKGRVSYSTTSPKLAKDVVDLCRSLGMVAVASPEKRTQYKSGTCFNIQIQCEKSKKPKLFTLSGKKRIAEEYAASVKREEHKKYLPIAGIEETDELEDMTCFTVDSEEGLFLCTDYVVTHNSTIMTNIAANMALNGYYSIFLSLEDKVETVRNRYAAIVGNFDASYAQEPKPKWPEDLKKAYKDVYAKNSPVYNMCTIVNGTESMPTCSIIEGTIKQWKDILKERGIPDEKVCGVFVDYVSRVSHAGLKGLRRDPGLYERELAIMDELTRIAGRQNVILWTALQANRDAVKKNAVDKSGVANSIGALFPCAAAFGVTVPKKDGETDSSTMDNQDYDSRSTSDKRLTRCDRKLRINVIKMREAATEGDVFYVYQGPSLRIWTNDKEARRAEEWMRMNNKIEMYAAMRR